MRRISLLFVAICLFLCESLGAVEKPNVLFIAIDDMRPELGCYGSKIAKSPNLDRLASQGLLFQRAYCQQAICRPSRASLLTGSRPDTTGIFHNYIGLRDQKPDIVTLPQHFAESGYHTVYCGKIFHRGDEDVENSWNRKPSVKRLKISKPKTRGGFALAKNQEITKKVREEARAKYGELARRGLGQGPAYESADVPDHGYIDGYNTELAIASIKEMAAEGDKPFFLGLGFLRPHLNWNAPSKYWDMYDRSKLPLALNAEAPKEGAAVGLHASFELRTRHGIPKEGPIDDELSRTLLHGYLACVSYVDAQIGKAIQALEDAGVRDNTIIVVWGDHGWHLGEMGVWGKATNYEIATRVPLMIWTPEILAKGKSTDALVELVDIYPTLCDLAGLKKPDHLEGKSFAPLMKNPNQPWKKAAFSQFPSPALREWAAYPLSAGLRETFFGPLIEGIEKKIMVQQGDAWNRELFEQYLMGYTMRTERYRLVIWRDRRKPESEAVFTELFDHKTDPHETENVAAQNPKIVAQLEKQLRAGWRTAK